MIRTPYLAIPFLLALATAAAGCRGDTQSATEPAATTSTTTTTGFSEAFIGVLPVQGSSFTPFTVTQATTVSVTLASLTPGGIGLASTAAVRLGLGVPSGTGCSITSAVNAAPALTAQLTAALTPETYCVDITDVGSLTVPLNFVIRIAQGASTTTAASAITETFSSFLATGGSTSRSVPLSQGGTISLTLTSVTPSSVVGLGVGLPNPGGSGCNPSTSLIASASTAPQITVPVDAGTYCVQIFDAGSVTGQGAFFSMTIAHP